MYCSKCGSNNADGAAFCSNCGAPLGQPQQANEVPQQPAQDPNVQQNYYAQPEQPAYKQPEQPAYNQAPQYQQQAPQYQQQAPQYQQQAPQYGQASYGQAPYGQPPVKKKKNKALPWIIVGAAVVVVAAIVLVLVLVLGGNNQGSPEDAAIAFVEGSLDFDFDKVTSVVHPAMLEDVDKEEFNEMKDELGGFSINYSNVKVEEAEHSKDDCEYYEEEFYDYYDLDVDVEDVCYVTVSFDVEMFGMSESTDQDLTVFEVDGKWYVYPDDF